MIVFVRVCGLKKGVLLITKVYHNKEHNEVWQQRCDSHVDSSYCIQNNTCNTGVLSAMNLTN